MSSVAHTIYFVWYTPAGARKPKKSRFRMTPEDAAKRYEGLKYELCERDKINIPAGLDVNSNRTGDMFRLKR